MYEINENQLRIDTERANSTLKPISFANNFQLKPEGTPCEFTETMVHEYENCIDDYMYFITRYMKIVQLDKGIITFEPYDYQKTMIKNFYENRFTINYVQDNAVNQQLLLLGFYIMFCLMKIKL